MKKLLINTVFFLVSLNSIGQSLSLDKLINIQKKEVEEVNDFLINKGWEFNSSNSSEDEFMRRVGWAFGKNSYNDNAIAWLSIMYLDKTANIVRYLTWNKNVYSSIKLKALEYKMNVINSNVKSNSIRTDYGGKNYVLSIIIEPGEHNSSKYDIAIIPREVYNKLPK